MKELCNIHVVEETVKEREILIMGRNFEQRLLSILEYSTLLDNEVNGKYIWKSSNTFLVVH